MYTTKSLTKFKRVKWAAILIIRDILFCDNIHFVVITIFRYLTPATKDFIDLYKQILFLENVSSALLQIEDSNIQWHYRVNKLTNICRLTRTCYDIINTRQNLYLPSCVPFINYTHHQLYSSSIIIIINYTHHQLYS